MLYVPLGQETAEKAELLDHSDRAVCTLHGQEANRYSVSIANICVYRWPIETVRVSTCGLLSVPLVLV